MDVSPKQVVSAATACIPFLKTMTRTVRLWERTCNVKLYPSNPEAPFVGTGMEHVSARDSGAAVICEA